jgi:hypothetical protein
VAILVVCVKLNDVSKLGNVLMQAIIHAISTLYLFDPHFLTNCNILQINFSFRLFGMETHFKFFLHHFNILDHGSQTCK